MHGTQMHDEIQFKVKLEVQLGCFFMVGEALPHNQWHRLAAIVGVRTPTKIEVVASGLPGTHKILLSTS